uniref:Uncharacterized protein n=1 Tax=Oryzias melastigma TaxID=30732 RepID=A0A3B3CE09_ORYME
MIQSSQPSSLKFTCRAFLLHLVLDFLPCQTSSATRMALSCWLRPLLSSPSCRRSTSVSDLLSVTLSWKQRCTLNISQTSRTSQPDLVESSGSRDREASSRLEPEVCKPPGALLNILNSAPTSSSFSERVETSNRYFCLRRGECKRLSARIKEENNCCQIHLGCTVFRQRRERGEGGGLTFSHRGLLWLFLVFQTFTLNLPQTNCS